MGGSTAAFIIAKQNQYVRRFKGAGAVSPETAVELIRIGCRDSCLFQRLVGRGVFKATSQERYYIDIAAADEFRRDRRNRALIALLITLAILAIVMYFATR